MSGAELAQREAHTGNRKRGRSAGPRLESLQRLHCLFAASSRPAATLFAEVSEAGNAKTIQRRGAVGNTERRKDEELESTTTSRGTDRSSDAARDLGTDDGSTATGDDGRTAMAGNGTASAMSGGQMAMAGNGMACTTSDGRMAMAGGDMASAMNGAQRAPMTSMTGSAQMMSSGSMTGPGFS